MCGLHVRVNQFSSLFEENLLRAELNFNLLILSCRRIVAETTSSCASSNLVLRAAIAPRTSLTTRRTSADQCFHRRSHMNDVIPNTDQKDKPYPAGGKYLSCTRNGFIKLIFYSSKMNHLLTKASSSFYDRKRQNFIHF